MTPELRPDGGSSGSDLDIGQARRKAVLYARGAGNLIYD